MKCPKCAKALKGFIDIKCQDQVKCKFTIGSKRFDEIVKVLYTPGRNYSLMFIDEGREMNLSDFNNFKTK